MALVKVILGSTRPNRFGAKPAAWLMELTKEHPQTTFELVDLQEINLPFLDEPQPALHGVYKNQHTKEWSKVIDAADGFIFVAGEYNHVPTPALINAIDYLAAEWRYKPAAFVSYGAAAGGMRAVEHLRTQLATVSVYDIDDQVAFVNYWAQLDADGNLLPTEAQIAGAHKLLENIGFWAEELKPVRAKLKAKVPLETKSTLTQTRPALRSNHTPPHSSR